MKKTNEKVYVISAEEIKRAARAQRGIFKKCNRCDQWIEVAEAEL